MSLPKRCRSFLFEPQAFLNDPAVLRMNGMERGAYATLLFSLWDMPEPGVVEDNDHVLSALSRMNGEWDACRVAVSLAFDTTSRPGYWIQKRLKRTHDEQTLYAKNQVESGRRGGKAKARNRKQRLGKPKASLRLPTDTDTLFKAPFVVPEIQEIKDYCSSKGVSLDAEQFWNFYQSKGWKVGSQKMSDWRAAVATWMLRDKKEVEGKPTRKGYVTPAALNAFAEKLKSEGR
jgi:uncharacterized protein YdaU (DUF1376 family)